jgi:formylmethanofuran dehydrogenase subunit B
VAKQIKDAGRSAERASSRNLILLRSERSATSYLANNQSVIQPTEDAEMRSAMRAIQVRRVTESFI